MRERGVDLLLHRLRALMAALVRVPVAEGDVFGGDLDVARAGFDQTARQQAALTEPAGVVGVVGAARLERQVERLRGRRGQQAIGRFERPDQRLALEVARVLVDRLLRQQLLVELAAAQEARVAQFGRRPDRGGGVLRIRNQERSVFGAEKAGRVKRLHRRALPPISMFWPMAMNAGTLGFFGPSVLATTEPMCGIASDCGGM